MTNFTKGHALESQVNKWMKVWSDKYHWVCYDLRKESQFRGELHDFLILMPSNKGGSILAFDCKECREETGRFYLSKLMGSNGLKQLATFGMLTKNRCDVKAGFLIWFDSIRALGFMPVQMLKELQDQVRFITYEDCLPATELFGSEAFE